MALILEHKCLLLANLVRNAQVINRARNAISPADFADLDRPFGVIWQIGLDWYVTSGMPARKEILSSNLKAQQERSPGYMSDDMWAYSHQLVDYVYSVHDEVINADQALKWLQVFLDDKKVRPALANMASAEDIPEMLRTLTKRVNSTRVTSDGGSNLFDLSNPDCAIVSGARFPTGCVVFDRVTSGGVRSGEVCAILGPSGGGKTTLALQVAVAFARTHGSYVHVYSYEQPIHPEVRERMWSCATGISRKKIENIPFEHMEAGVQAEMRRHARELEHVVGFDMTKPGKGQDGMDEIETYVAQEHAAGRSPGALVIDWMSIMARRYVAKRNLKDADIRSVLLTSVNRCKMISSNYKCVVFLVQQLSGEAASRRSVNAQLDHTDAMDCKGLALECDFAVVIGPKDPASSACRIWSSKARNVGNAHCIAILDGEHNRFQLNDGEFTSVVARDGTARLVSASAVDGVETAACTMS